MDNPIVGLIMGSIFGACLVLSGLTDPDKVIGSLRLKDFHVLRTVIVFMIVGMLGTFVLQKIGVANLHIKPAAILAVVIGGVIFGAGLGLSGYFPGAALAGAASGRIDALATIPGMFLGAHIYILLFPSLIVPLEKMANFGKVTLPQVTNLTDTIWIIPVFVVGLLVLSLTIPRRSGQIRRNIKAEDLEMDEVFSDPVSPIPIPKAKDDIYLKTDCFEAAQVFSGWKNVFFLIIFVCLVLLQAAFWITSDRYFQINEYDNPGLFPVLARNTDNSGQTAMQDENQTLVANAENQANQEWHREIIGIDITMSIEVIEDIINITNIVLISISAIYVIILFFSMAASFVGRLGGLGDISSSFVLSLIIFILIIPWHAIFGSAIPGVVYTPGELEGWLKLNNSDILNMALIYLRFTGFWMLIIILLVLSQFRSHKWAKSIRLRYQQAL